LDSAQQDKDHNKISSNGGGAYGVYTPSRCSPSEIAHQIEYEQDNEYQAEPTTAPGMAPVSISAATEEKNKDNNEED